MAINETRDAYTQIEAFFAVIENDKKTANEQVRWSPKSPEAKVIRGMNEIKAWLSWEGRTYGNS